MSSPTPSPSVGDHLELPVPEQIGRARPWEPAPEPVLDDLSDEEEAGFLLAIRR